MKNLMYTLLSVTVMMMFASCDVAVPIHLDKNFFEASYVSQELIFHADENINYYVFDTTKEWIKFTVKDDDRKTLIVNLDENTSGEDRDAIIYVKNFINQDKLTIVQKAKPVL